MKKFQFRFSAVLKLRKSREEQAVRDLGRAQAAYQNELDIKSRLLAGLSEALERREKLCDRSIDLTALQLEQDFITGSKARIIRADQAIVRAARNVEKMLRIYLAARQKSRSVEVLHDKDLATYRKELSRREQKMSDDFTIMRERLKEQSA